VNIYHQFLFHKILFIIIIYLNSFLNLKSFLFQLNSFQYILNKLLTSQLKMLRINFCCFSLVSQEVVDLYLQLDCCRSRNTWVSMWNNTIEFDKDENEIYFTLLICNVSLKYCIPWSPIWLLLRSRKVSVYVK
jgi:hypothetical protein